MDCGYSLEPHQGGSKEYPQSMFLPEIRKISEFLPENIQVKFSIYLNRRVFVMWLLLAKVCAQVLYVFNCLED